MKRKTRSADSERGAMLAQAVIALLALIAMTTFVVDFGVLWVGRNAAQNAADAGALAGATAMAFDNYTDHTVTGPAVLNALRIAKDNLVAGQRPAVDPATDIKFPTCPDGTTGCIKVTVYRNQSHGNPLPIIFGNIVGLGAPGSGHGVLATATAEVLAGNASNCLKPWVIPDKWQENSVPPNTTFDKYIKSGGRVIPDPSNPNPDSYTPPSKSGPGTGYNPATDITNTPITLKAGSPSGSISPGFFFPVDLPLPPSGAAITGGSQYRTNIESCTGWPVQIGTPSNPSPLPPENGNMVGPTKQGIDALIAEDPNAYWSNKAVVNSCAPGCATISPRIVGIAVVDPDVLAYSILASGGKNLVLNVTNILGFFIAGQNAAGDVQGYLTNYPGLTIGTPNIGPGGSFLLNPVLVR